MQIQLNGALLLLSRHFSPHDRAAEAESRKIGCQRPQPCLASWPIWTSGHSTYRPKGLAANADQFFCHQQYALLQHAIQSCYTPTMLKTRIRKMAAARERAVGLLSEVTASIRALSDDDLLDLADIFSAEAKTTLGEMAAAEMQRRNLSL